MKTHVWMKTIFVFVNGELYKQISYDTQKIARSHLRHFKLHGICDPNTGLTIANATFEMI